LVVREVAAEALRNIGGKSALDQLEDKPRADAGQPAMQLPDTERQYLWDIEHHGNLLVRHGFGALSRALKNADRAALSRVLAADFAGTDLNKPVRVRVVTDF